jgi:diaminohydroxyphosphoribosylaminopyrimidine deaminase/5-amino-6-(5-phosphoribosylamino)uracil reductase
LALRQAGTQAKGATLYVTLEPCSTWGRTPPCTDAIVAAGVTRVVVAVRDPNPVHAGRGIKILRRAGIRVTEHVGTEEALALIAPFAKWITTGKPYVTLKMGMSLDGKIADFAGKSRWITGEQSRQRVMRLRQKADAIMVGIGTAVADDPSLLPAGKTKRQIYRIIVDSNGRLPLKAKVLNDGHVSRTIIATTAGCTKARQNRYRAKGAQVWELKPFNHRVSLKQLLVSIGHMGLLHVLCEGGGEMAAELVKERLVDHYLFFVAPRILGGREATSPIEGNGWNLKNAPRLAFVDCERSGEDILLRAVSQE